MTFLRTFAKSWESKNIRRYLDCRTGQQKNIRNITLIQVTSNIGYCYSVRRNGVQHLGETTNCITKHDFLETCSRRTLSDDQPRLTYDIVDSSTRRQARTIDAAIHSQTEIDEANTKTTYASYTQTPELRQRVETVVQLW